MTVSVDFAALRQTEWTQYAIRFVLGGLVTVCAGLLAQQFGPVFGGLFLAFPAIFPAGATLIAKRETQKKEKKGLDGRLRGARAAALDAAGTVLGALALIAFAAIIWKGLPRWAPVLVLGGALIFWLLASLSLWWLRKQGWLALR